jgi:hypothetical protein
MSLDDLEDQIHNERQQRRLQDQLDAWEADAALDGLVGPAPARPLSGSTPKRRKGAGKHTAASVEAEATVETSAIYGFADPDFRLAHPLPEFEPPSDPIERHKLPGWTGFAEFDYLAKHPPRRTPRRAGRPPGPSFIQTRAEIETAYRELWTQRGRRPYWSEVAKALMVDERTLKRARREFGLDSRAISQTSE